jgi:hypothetical protein
MPRHYRGRGITGCGDFSLRSKRQKRLLPRVYFLSPRGASRGVSLGTPSRTKCLMGRRPERSVLWDAVPNEVRDASALQGEGITGCGDFSLRSKRQKRLSPRAYFLCRPEAQAEGSPLRRRPERSERCLGTTGGGHYRVWRFLASLETTEKAVAPCLLFVVPNEVRDAAQSHARTKKWRAQAHSRGDFLNSPRVFLIACRYYFEMYTLVE